MAVQEDKTDGKNGKSTTNNLPITAIATETPVLSEEPESTTPVPQEVKPSNSSKKSKAKKSKTSTKKEEPAQEPDKSLIETKEEMYQRLMEGVDFVNYKVKGLIIAGGTLENPVITTRTVTYPEDQTNQLLSEISEIKHLLFCRLVLGHAALLPAALRANSVEEFLADPEVTPGALRDFCLKMEHPGLQEIRDACADLFRADEEDDDMDMSEELQEKDVHPYDQIRPFKKQKREFLDKWMSKQDLTEKSAKEMGMMPTYEDIVGGEGTAVQFGKAESKVPEKKIRVKICGRSIWNYPSNKAMSRGGWLHFCIIAKDSDLHDAIALCRHWDEFFELNILVIWGYFPGKNWTNWAGNQYRQQMLRLVRKSNNLTIQHGKFLTSFRGSLCTCKLQSRMHGK